MIEKLSTWLASIAKGWLIMILFAADLAFMGSILPSVQAKIEAFSGGIGPLDLTFFPSVEKTLAAIAAYGADGRPFYATTELTTDIIYPIVYTFFFSLLITALLQHAFDKTSKIQRLNVIPFGAWLFDLLENICIVILLLSFPAQSAAVAGALTIMNGLKWLFAGVSVLALLFAFGALLFKKIKRA